MGMIGLSLFASAQSAPPRVVPAEAKKHIGESATVCGKVVDTKISKYGIAGRGKPVTFDLDQPEPNPVFYFVAFGAQPGGPEEVISAYKDKSVCVTGKITATGGTPYIMAGDRTQIKPQTGTK
jgi:micrococcal nuclease